VADFLRLSVRVIAPIVIERLDQRGPAGTAALPRSASSARPIKSRERCAQMGNPSGMPH